MSQYNRADIYRMVEEEDVRFVRLQFTDVFGTMKNVAVTVSQLEKVLNNECMFDGSSVEGFARIEESDMYLYPDLDSFEIFPWRPQQGKVARLICDVYRSDKKPFEGDPRHILKKVVVDAEEKGYEFKVGPECEFFLFHTDEEGKATTNSNEVAGYFDLGPLDLGENTRRDIVLTLENMGIGIEASHHESAPAQHEIDLSPDNPITMADSLMTFKLVAKTIANRHGMHATFMPKPKSDGPGSGLHLNFSITRDGENIFYDENDVNHLSEEAYCFIGGLMKHMKAITFIVNPTVNSYKRFVPGHEAPNHIAWSCKNRSPLIRIPAASESSARVELRSPDATTNPYLAFALCIAAGMDGINNKIQPPESVDVNLFELTSAQREELNIEDLPKNLIEAIKEFEKDELVISVLGEEMAKKMIELKRKEYQDYRNQVTQWEIEQYLHKM